MKTWLRRGAFMLSLAVFGCLALPQGLDNQTGPPGSHRRGEPRLPNGKSQRDEILKADWENNLKDAAELARLSDELKVDMEKENRYVLSVSTLKKADEIEKIIKRIRSRLRRT